MHQIICIGSSCKDIFFPTDEGKTKDTPEDILSQKKIEFELGAKYKIKERYEALGGCAANVACGLAKLGIKTACYSRIGDDSTSDWIIKELEKNMVDASPVTKEPSFASDMSAIIIDEKSGDRIIFSNQKVNTKLEIAEEKLKDCQWFFIGDLEGEWDRKISDILSIAEKNGIKVAYNPRYSNIHENPEKIKEAISKTDIVFLNKDEAIEIAMKNGVGLSEKELDDEEKLIEKIQEINQKIAIITDGVRGAWGFDGKNILHQEAKVVRAKDSTGAGDSFAAAFLSAQIKGKSIQEGLQWGITNSSSVVSHYGSIEGLLDENKIVNN